MQLTVAAHRLERFARTHATCGCASTLGSQQSCRALLDESRALIRWNAGEVAKLIAQTDAPRRALADLAVHLVLAGRESEAHARRARTHCEEYVRDAIAQCTDVECAGLELRKCTIALEKQLVAILTLAHSAIALQRGGCPLLRSSEVGADNGDVRWEEFIFRNHAEHTRAFKQCTAERTHDAHAELAWLADDFITLDLTQLVCAAGADNVPACATVAAAAGAAAYRATGAAVGAW